MQNRRCKREQNRMLNKREQLQQQESEASQQLFFRKEQRQQQAAALSSQISLLGFTCGTTPARALCWLCTTHTHTPSFIYTLTQTHTHTAQLSSNQQILFENIGFLSQSCGISSQVLPYFSLFEKKVFSDYCCHCLLWMPRRPFHSCWVSKYFRLVVLEQPDCVLCLFWTVLCKNEQGGECRFQWFLPMNVNE